MPPSELEGRSNVFTYRFAPQDFKFREGSNCLVASSLLTAGKIVELDSDKGLVKIRRGVSKGALPDTFSAIPTGPINTAPLRKAVYRYADAVLMGENPYRAVQDLLDRAEPRFSGGKSGTPIVEEGEDLIAAATSAVSNLENSYLFIQGPPGSGKTFTSSSVIVELMRAGQRVGVSSNSHKAINHLLGTVEKQAAEAGVEFYGIKKCTVDRPDTFFDGRMIEDVTRNEDVDVSADLIAGTAWTFARPEFDGVLDYLFIDEAGQVSLASVVAMGLSARNIVLVGDQMQLGQPIQGVHPGESGRSVLDYLLRDHATIPPERGIFLPTTWRMHKGVCDFISEAVYDGRLHPEPENANQRLILTADAHPSLAPTGLKFILVDHSGCSQKSEPEGELLREIYSSLLNQRYRDRGGNEHSLGADDILVVTPYNVQVNYLGSILPRGARVGTVDKFQGQEAEVVLISMVTSSAEELPRNIEFLYSRNRLNVAISRARSLAMILASPRLLEIKCATVNQMKLVNTLCWAKEYADRV